MKPDLFVRKDFISSAGKKLTWKIDCDALTNDDIETLAFIISKKLIFKKVIGIPSGGMRLAKALSNYVSDGPILIVDDVLTTGSSMKKIYKEYPSAIGVVIFARGECPDWVIPMFSLDSLIF